MKLLALDQGSDVTGAAYFDAGRLLSLDRFKATGPDWLAHMEAIASQLRQAARGRSWKPDVVAIEDVMLGMNANSLAVMGETRGYLKHEARTIWPGVRILDIHPSTSAAIGGGGRYSEDRKAATVQFALDLMARHGIEKPAGLLFDENVADAISVGVAAIWKLGASVTGVERKKATGWAAVVVPAFDELARVGMANTGERGAAMT